MNQAHGGILMVQAYRDGGFRYEFQINWVSYKSNFPGMVTG
jgi:hypothetical protein